MKLNFVNNGPQENRDGMGRGTGGSGAQEETLVEYRATLCVFDAGYEPGTRKSACIASQQGKVFPNKQCIVACRYCISWSSSQQTRNESSRNT